MFNIDEHTHGTDPKNADSDGDGMPDGWEVHNELEPTIDDAGGDLDGDGLTNADELGYGTKPNDADTDDDGLEDDDELSTHGTNPTNWDTDADTLPDGWDLKKQRIGES